jgi:hypothetical protein
LTPGDDPVTNTLYVGNFDNADLSPINTATCNAHDKSGCPAMPPEIVVGSEPSALVQCAASPLMF